MKRALLSLVLNAIALLLVAKVFSGFHLESFAVAIIASLILAILNAVVKPILLLFTLPINLLTLGLFTFVINAVTLMLTQALIGSDFVIDSFGVAILAAIVLSVINLILNKLVKDPLLKK
ncbi:phage holin family protein [Amphibacillus indicireducens]|uniref:Phage holin family protein n=1 Tax=Amphibacillus indicireducens TaxID=1076330 RepID=A0ABP7VE65_9BACI